ncbi:MAG: aminotransferase class V-fold PLP-dependent enzyme [Clostridiales bacterium]|nr:aminotransferase class V-fold PLP-dependent enzyme [Clostridiales bacterium]
MIYFDNASTTLIKPDCVLKANAFAAESLSANAGRGSHAAAVKAASIVYNARKAVAELVGADEVIFTFNCTDALNTVIFGTARRGHVVTTVFDHNSVLRPLNELSKRNIIRYTAVKPDVHGVIDPKDVERAIRPDTYMIIVNHISNVVGTVAPVTSIGAIARRHGLLYAVDGAQSIGYDDVNMKQIGCDYLCFSPHKGLHAMQGIGCLCVRSGAPLRPFRFGGTGTASHSLDQPADIPEGYECGTLPVHSIHALTAAVNHYKKMSLETKKNLIDCGEALRKGLDAIPGVTVYGKLNQLPNIVCFNLENTDAAMVGDILNDEYDIAVRCGLHCAPLAHKTLGTIKTGAVRASLSYHNTMDEVEFFLKAIREII